MLDFLKNDGIINLVHDFGELCNGSTADSDSACEGSNPSSAATKTVCTVVSSSTPASSTPIGRRVPPAKDAWICANTSIRWERNSSRCTSCCWNPPPSSPSPPDSGNAIRNSSACGSSRPWWKERSSPPASSSVMDCLPCASRPSSPSSASGTTTAMPRNTAAPMPTSTPPCRL